MRKPNIRNILVPIDFSKLSSSAIETAKGLARKFDARIHLAHVHEFYYPAGFMMPAAPVPLPMITYRDNAATRLSRDLKMLAKEHGLPPENCQVLEGTPTFREICNLAQKIPADLIVMPTHGYTGIDHFFEGSTAERIVQHSPCPVLIARKRGRKSSRISSNEKASGNINTILVPVDFSDCSLEGLKYAIQFADYFAAKILLLDVVQLGYAYTADGFAMYDFSALEEAARKGAEGEMCKFVRCAKFGGVKFETAVKVGLPVDDICAFAQNRDVDLIITSTHGHTGFKHVLIGSTAEQLVRRANRPILVVPSHPEVRASQLTQQNQHMKKTKRTIVGKRTLKRKSIESEQLTKKYRKRTGHSFPERRQTNKFRESHSR